MTDSSRPIDRASRMTPAAPVEGRRRPGAPVDDARTRPAAEAASFDGVPASPPDDVLAEVDAAMAHLERLHAAGASVSFETGPDGLRIDLVEGDGSRRPIGPSELFDLASGGTGASAPDHGAERSGPEGPGQRVDREA